MHKMIDIALQGGDLRALQSETRAREITTDGDQLRLVDTPQRTQLLDLSERLFAREQIDPATAIQQFRNQETADETGAAGDEIICHVVLR